MAERDSPVLAAIFDENKEKAMTLLLQKLHDIWNNVGVDEEQRRLRKKQLSDYFLHVLQGFADEETSLYEDIKKRVKNYGGKIAELQTELQLPMDEDITGSLIEREELLRQKLDGLSRLKHERLKDFEELHVQELQLCEILGMPQINLSSTTGVPTEKDIGELQQQVKMLKEEKERRQKKLRKIGEKLE